MTKEQLAKFGIVVDKDLTDEEAHELIAKKMAEKEAEINKQKELITKRNGEIAELKRESADRLSEDEKKALAQQELEKELNELRRENALNKRIAEYVEIGYDKELATKIANAELDGKSTAQYHKQFVESQREKIKAELLADTPNPKQTNPSDPNSKFTKENFQKGLISMSEMNELKESNPTLYQEIIG